MSMAARQSGTSQTLSVSFACKRTVLILDFVLRRDRIGVLHAFAFVVLLL